MLFLIYFLFFLNLGYSSELVGSNGVNSVDSSIDSLAYTDYSHQSNSVASNAQPRVITYYVHNPYRLYRVYKNNRPDLTHTKYYQKHS